MCKVQGGRKAFFRTSLSDLRFALIKFCTKSISLNLIVVVLGNILFLQIDLPLFLKHFPDVGR